MAFEIRNGVLKKYTEEGETVVNIPDGVTKIDDSAFENCEKIVTLNIPEGVEEIGYEAFNNCKSLTSVYIPGSVKYIGGRAFDGCENLTTLSVAKNNSSYMSVDNVLYEKEEKILVYCPETKQTLFIPKWVEEIECFLSDCRELQSIEVDEKNPNYSDFDGALYDKQKKTLVCCPRGKISLSIFPETEIIGGYSCNFGNLRTVFIPDSVTEIQENAFAFCTSLHFVKLGSHVKEIGLWAFEGCYCLTSIEIPEGVVSISAGAFQSCFDLSEVSIPATVSRIGGTAFEDTEFLKNMGEWAIVNQNLLAYSGTASSVTIPQGVTKICSRAFQKHKELKSVVIPKEVQKIGYYCFQGCENLKSVTIQNTAILLEERCFENCSGLTDLYCAGKYKVRFGFGKLWNFSKMIDEAIKMLENKDFSMQLEEKLKYAFILGYFKETRDETAKKLLQENILEIFPDILEMNDIEAIQVLTETDGIITAENIDFLIELAIDAGKHEIYMILLNDKSEKIGFADIEKRLKL